MGEGGGEEVMRFEVKPYLATGKTTLPNSGTRESWTFRERVTDRAVLHAGRRGSRIDLVAS